MCPVSTDSYGDCTGTDINSSVYIISGFFPPFPEKDFNKGLYINLRYNFELCVCMCVKPHFEEAKEM